MLIGTPPVAGELGAALRTRLTGFAGFLHVNGFGIGAADAVAVLETSAQTGILDPQVLRWSLKSLLCGRGDEWRRFDRLFDAYFLPPTKRLFVEGVRARDMASAARGEGQFEPATGPGHGIAGDADSGSARHGASRE